jgi:hypothetical protein
MPRAPWPTIRATDRVYGRIRFSTGGLVPRSAGAGARSALSSSRRGGGAQPRTQDRWPIDDGDHRDVAAVRDEHRRCSTIELECACNRGAARAVLGESNSCHVAEARAEACRRSVRTLERRRADGDPAWQRCEGLQAALGREQPLVDLRALVVDDEGRHEQSQRGVESMLIDRLLCCRWWWLRVTLGAHAETIALAAATREGLGTERAAAGCGDLAQLRPEAPDIPRVRAAASASPCRRLGRSPQQVRRPFASTMRAGGMGARIAGARRARGRAADGKRPGGWTHGQPGVR